MPHRFTWIGVALSGLLGVAAGAFGAHGLQGDVAPGLLETFDTAVRYQVWHTLAMLGVLVWRQIQPLRGQRLVLALLWVQRERVMLLDHLSQGQI